MRLARAGVAQCSQSDPDLQQTPATSAKVMLKVFAEAPGTTTAETHVFSFTSPTAARAEADAIKDALSTAIQAAKSKGALSKEGGASSASMAIAGAIASTPDAGKGAKSWYDDEKLKKDDKLQISLLKANPSLSKTFAESMKAKPDSITKAQFNAEFWSTRVHLLRSHAIEKNQSRGAYNVLSTIKPYAQDEKSKLTVSKEQIQLIFNLHPLVKRVYDENVPKISESSFWAQFFQSRLLKKLKGEKITDADPVNPLLDKYLQEDDDAERGKRLMASHIPHIIDVEGNEENHSQRKGNRPDHTLRPKSHAEVPLIRRLNALSENILSQVAPNDVDPSQPIGMDEETFNSLALRDLQGDAEENRVILNIKDQSRFFNSDKGSGVSSDALLFAKQDPAKVLQSMRADLARLSPNTNLETAIGVDDDSDSSDDESSTMKGHVGSKASIAAATSQMLLAISEKRAQSDDLSASTTGSSTVQTSSTSGLSPAMFDNLSSCHATTTEFLQHFWSSFLSGDSAQVDDVAKRLESLSRAMERIKAIAKEAEAERQKAMDTLKKQVQHHFEKTGKRRKVDYEATPGGAKAVNELLAPTVKSIEVATRDYRQALAKQSQDAT